jgi:hypothetical protein
MFRFLEDKSVFLAVPRMQLSISNWFMILHVQNILYKATTQKTLIPSLDKPLPILTNLLKTKYNFDLYLCLYHII